MCGECTRLLLPATPAQWECREGGRTPGTCRTSCVAISASDLSALVICNFTFQNAAASFIAVVLICHTDGICSVKPQSYLGSIQDWVSAAASCHFSRQSMTKVILVE